MAQTPDNAAVIMVWRRGVAEPLVLQVTREDGERVLSALAEGDSHVFVRSYQALLNARRSTFLLNLTADAIDSLAVDTAPRVLSA